MVDNATSRTHRQGLEVTTPRAPLVSPILLGHGAALGLALGALVLATRASLPPLPGRLAEIAAVLVLVAVHLSLVARTWRRAPARLDLPLVMVGVVTGSWVLTFAPRFSSDVTAYIVYGRMSAIYGRNPALTTPTDVAADPAVGVIDAAHEGSVSVYGPLWTSASHGLTNVAESLGGDYDTYLALYFGVALVSALVSVWALWRLLGRWRPEHRLGGTLLFAWSPLLMVEVSSAHNDLFMLAFVALGVLLLSRDRVAAGFALLVVAALVKWIAVVALLVLGAAAVSAAGRGARVRQSLRLGGLAALIAIPTYALVGDPVRALPAPFGGAAGAPVNSLAEVVVEVAVRIDARLGLGLGAEMIGTAVSAAFSLLMVLALLAGMIAAFRTGSVRASITVAVVTLLALCLVAPRLWPWYALWPLLLAPLARTRVTVVSGLFASSVLLLYPLLPGGVEMPLLTAPRSVVATAPLLVAGAWFAALKWRSRARSAPTQTLTGA